MAAVHVGVGHDDDPVVAEFVEVEAAFIRTGPEAGADGGDHRADFVVVENLVEPRFLDVEQLAANRQHGLELPVAALFG